MDAPCRKRLRNATLAGHSTFNRRIIGKHGDENFAPAGVNNSLRELCPFPCQNLGLGARAVIDGYAMPGLEKVPGMAAPILPRPMKPTSMIFYPHIGLASPRHGADAVVIVSDFAGCRPNRTKMFHMKHFCPIKAQNLIGQRLLAALRQTGQNPRCLRSIIDVIPTSRYNTE
jgi:hypothetical protein